MNPTPKQLEASVRLSVAAIHKLVDLGVKAFAVRDCEFGEASTGLYAIAVKPCAELNPIDYVFLAIVEGTETLESLVTETYKRYQAMVERDSRALLAS